MSFDFIAYITFITFCKQMQKFLRKMQKIKIEKNAK